MRIPVALTLAAMALAAGCTTAGTNPNVLAPKVVMNAKGDGVVLFVHSAFGDHLYDWIAVSTDNKSEVNETQRYSVEEFVDASRFFLHVAAEAEDSTYHYRALVERTGDELAVTLVSAEGEWDEPRSVSLPYAAVLERVSP